MTNDGWDSKWASKPVFPQWLIDQAKRDEKEYINMYGTEVNPVALGVHPDFDKAADKVMSKASGVPADWFTNTSDVASEASGISGVWPTQHGFNDPAITESIAKLIKENFDTSQLKSQGSNLVHHQEYLYFQCDGCGEILDPHTKSFAKLQEARVKTGWNVKWNLTGMGYKVYCAECGEKVK